LQRGERAHDHLWQVCSYTCKHHLRHSAVTELSYLVLPDSEVQACQLLNQQFSTWPELQKSFLAEKHQELQKALDICFKKERKRRSIGCSQTSASEQQHPTSMIT